MEQVMNPKHPRWKEFVKRLGGSEGCNYRGNFKEPKTIEWDCEGHAHKTKAKEILNKMGDIDVPESLKFFEKHGGYCDCEILANVEHSFKRDEILSKGVKE